MQYNLSQIPLIKLLVPILLGIGIFEKWSIGFIFLFILSCLLCSLLLILHFISHHPTLKKWNTVSIYLLLFLLGGLLITQKQLTQQKNHFSNHNAIYAKGIIATDLQVKPKSYKTVLNIQQVYDSLQTAIPSTGNLLLYIEKDSSLLHLEIGDEILIRLHYNEIKAPKNIAEFDYQSYLKHQSIYHQQYLAKHQFIITQKKAGCHLKRLGFHISQYIRNILKSHIPKTENFALADGILLGNDDLIDRNLYDTFAQTGILHILSVSGLHVGIVYLLLQLLLSFIHNKSKKTKVVKFLIILICIWMFTLITGASTACVRAAILFTLIHSGTLQKEHVNSINLLAGAALIQVLYNANVIYDIGFQLSYLAMLGLFIFYKPIYAALYFKSYALDKVWQLWSASIAAQLLTLPLSIYYFGNFPTYFLIANLYAIPLSFVILWSCILLIPFSYIPILGIYWGKFISIQIAIFIYLSQWIAAFPFGKINQIYLSKIQFYLLLIAMLLSCLSIILKNTRYIWMCLLVVLMSILLSYPIAIRQFRKQQLVVYAISKNVVLGTQHKGVQQIYAKDSIRLSDWLFSIQNANRYFQIQESKQTLLDTSIQDASFYYKNNLMVVKNKVFYFLNKQNTRTTFEQPLPVDYLFLSDNCYLDIPSIQANFKFQKIVIGSDNDAKHIRIYKRLLQEQQLPFVDLNNESMFIQLEEDFGQLPE